MTNTSVLAVDAMSLALFGRRLLPYQTRHIVTPITEVLDGRRFTHRRVVVLLPRQTGKTTTLLCIVLARLATMRGYHCVYAAQQGTVSTRRFALTGGWIDLVEASPQLPGWTTTRSQGREAIANPRHLSYLMALNPRPGAARSDSLDTVVLDECQEHTHDRATQIEGDLGPTFATRPWHQKILAGTATDGPTWWRDQVKAARRGDPGAGHLIELGTWPDDADPTDPATWRAHHPGLQAGLTTEEFLTEQLQELGVDAFAREYGNRFSDTPADAPVPLDAWDACTSTAGGELVAVAFDVTLDRRHATVVGVTDRDNVSIRWMGPPDQLATALPADLPVYALPHQSGLAADLAAAGITVHIMPTADYRRATQQLHDAVVDQRLHHNHEDHLRRAWAFAARSWHGDTWTLSARRSGGDITPAVAAAVAWGATRHADAMIL